MDMRTIMVLFLYCCLNDVTKAIDLDYFFSSARSSGCNTSNSEQYCKSVCGGVPAICKEGDCYCHQSILNAKLSKQIKAVPKTQIIVKLIDDDYSGEYVPERDFMLRPTLRHHIAHFCPDLNKARECIKKCVQIGKPAFCGKDHKCYCGHRYDYKSKDNPNAEKTYKQFADMYAKYLGYRPNNNDH